MSRPVLTFGGAGTQAGPGDLVELHCEAQRGSPPIFYRFYHETVVLGNGSAPSGGGASFNFSLTGEHSGNFSCEASNGQGAQRSDMVTLNLTGICEVWGLSRSVCLPGILGELPGVSDRGGVEQRRFCKPGPFLTAAYAQNRRHLPTSGRTAWLLGSLSCLSLVTVALFCYWLKRETG